jgi:AI-2 transport protein TqsA
MRTGLAIGIAVVLVEGGLIAFALAIVVSLGRLVTVLPDYADDWEKTLDGVRSTLAGWGIGKQQVDQLLHSISPQTVISALGDVLAGVARSTGGLVLLLATALFMTAESVGVPQRLAAVAGAERLNEALNGFARNTRRYIVVTSIFGFAVAVLDTIALVVLGVPLPFLWGLLSFLTNFVPNIGFILGLAPPTVLGLLAGGPGTAVLVVVLYCLINFVVQSVIQPVFVGDAVGMSVTLSFLSVILWTVVLGPMGAILAVPLSLLVIAVVVGQDPDRPWARTLLAGASGGPPRERHRTKAKRAAKAEQAAPAEQADPAGQVG